MFVSDSVCSYCPSGFTEVALSGGYWSCFWMSDYNTTWSNANLACQTKTNNGQLAVITSQEKQQSIVQKVFGGQRYILYLKYFQHLPLSIYLGRLHILDNLVWWFTILFLICISATWSNMSGDAGYWIGAVLKNATGQAEFMWLGDVPMSFTNWKQNNVSHTDPEKKCLKTGETHKWMDKACTNLNYFLC